METKQKKLNAYLFLYTLLAATTLTMRAIASFLHLNEYGYYEDELCRSANITILLGCLILFGYALVHRKDESKQASFGGPLTYAPATPLAICLILLGVSFFKREADGMIAEMLLPLLGILAMASALYFLFAVLYEFKLCDLRAVFGMICSLFLVFYAGFLYFDSTLPINATTKLIDQTAFVFAAVFFLYETRISLGQERWPTYTALGLVSSLLCAYASVPSLLVYFLKGRIISNSIEESFVVFFLFCYIFCRTVLSLILKPEKPTPFMAALHEDAKRLSDAVAAHGPLPFEPTPALVEENAEAADAEVADTQETNEATEAPTEETTEIAENTDSAIFTDSTDKETEGMIE